MTFVGSRSIGQDADNRTNLIFVTSEDGDVIQKTEIRWLRTAVKYHHKVDDLVGGKRIDLDLESRS